MAVGERIGTVENGRAFFEAKVKSGPWLQSIKVRCTHAYLQVNIMLADK
jgi:hypothetical protein